VVFRALVAIEVNIPKERRRDRAIIESAVAKCEVVNGVMAAIGQSANDSLGQVKPQKTAHRIQSFVRILKTLKKLQRDTKKRQKTQKPHDEPLEDESKPDFKVIKFIKRRDFVK
jgi:hypothetical protein